MNKPQFIGEKRRRVAALQSAAGEILVPRLLISQVVRIDFTPFTRAKSVFLRVDSWIAAR